VVNIVNQSAFGIGGFRHFSGLLPVTPMDGDAASRGSVRLFHVPAVNVNAIFRGDIVCFGNTTPAGAATTAGNKGGGDIIPNIGAPSASVVIGGGGGSFLGNASIAPNVIRYVATDTTAIIAGVVVGFGPISLYMAKNGFQFIPTLTEAWVYVETDPQIEMAATVPTVPGTAFNLILNDAIDVIAAGSETANRQTRFGVSGLALDPATFNTTATLPLRILGSGNQIGNDPTAAGFVANVMFNPARHFRGSAGFAAD
jgi:hypothetical protein